MTYAARTDVPVAKTRTEIEALLRKVKASRIIHVDEPSEAIVMFNLEGRLIRFTIPVPENANDQRRRSIWRAILLVIKAKIEAVAQGITTVEQEWLAHVVLPDGQTVAQWIEPQLQIAYEAGAMPSTPLLLEGPKPSTSSILEGGEQP
jgi:hypothetical protein